MLMRNRAAGGYDWETTLSGEPRGYIQPHALDELWFHTGTACNLACPFCLEGSVPGDTRLDRIRLDDARPFIDEALTLGVKQFSFTGGEPFIVKDFINILGYSAALRPCLVLTNGTDPVLKRLDQIEKLADSAHPISFRISIDYPDRAQHDEGRGAGNFEKAFDGMRHLHELGFHVSVARQAQPEEDSASIDKRYQDLLTARGLPAEIRIVSFPDFGIPGEQPNVPDVTEDCMTRYHTEDSRQKFMCAFSKMIIKKNGQMRVYACTLVDDDDSYDLGTSLATAQAKTIRLGHHRCYTCFAFGSSCSEL
jgi:molybdenum cofactor biosynthesis enzyme MoaA